MMLTCFTADWGIINTSMPLVRINEENCYKALEAAQRRFQRSNAPERLKRIARKVNPIVFLCGRKPQWLAAAYGVSVRAKVPERQILDLRESHTPYTVIGKRGYYLLIQVYPKSFSKLEMTSWRYLKRVIAHELGHLIHSCTEKQDGYLTGANPETDHCEEWQRISRWCGGNTEPEIAYCK